MGRPLKMNAKIASYAAAQMAKEENDSLWLPLLNRWKHVICAVPDVAGSRSI